MEQKNIYSVTQLTSASSTTQSPESQETSSERKLMKKKVFSALNFGVLKEGDLVESLENNQRKYLIYLEHESECRQVVLHLAESATVEMAIRDALNFFSTLYNLKNHPEKYELFVAKKNGKPKTEFPAFQLDQLMHKTRNTEFSLKFILTKNVCSVKESNSTYENTLKGSNYQKKPSQEIGELITKKPQRNWFYRILGCGCDQE